ncbi:MAG: hypothetical protein HYU36_03455 [Planctomycetes bacterium]|nr:hypothetical protein [Planctomycetota bacterium]
MPKKEKDDLDFEIEFFEGIVQHDPSYQEPLMALGHAYTQRGLYQKGLEVDRQLVRLRPDDPIAYYNLACSLSLLNELDSGFDALLRALQLGYRDYSYLLKDPDLASLRKDPRFSRLVLARLTK